MTAIITWRLGEEGIVFLTDAAGYDDDGIVQQFGSKVLLMPEVSCVITSNGAGAALSVLYQYLVRGPASFDELKYQLPGAAWSAFDKLAQIHGAEIHASFNLLIGGWSDTNNRFETFMLCTEPAASAEKTYAAFELHPIPASASP